MLKDCIEQTNWQTLFVFQGLILLKVLTLHFKTRNRNMDVQDIKQRFGIIGNNLGLNRAIEVAVQVAPTDLSVLITGGKWNR